MRAIALNGSWLVVNALAITLWACGTPEENGSDAGGSPNGSGPTASTSSNSGATTSGDLGNGNAVSGTVGGSSTTGSGGMGGVAETMGATGTSASAGGASLGSGDATTGSATSAASGGSANAGVTGGTTGASGTGCTIGPWPAADPAMPGPFATVTEENVGPLAGEDDNGEPVAFTMFRPEELGDNGLCHPVVTWGNGTGSNPGLYGVLLKHLASHGFVVIASDSPQVASGDPPPMVAGVTWVIEQNDDPASVLYQHIDVTHVGATGHSQGGFATTQAGGDDQITTIAPLCGASPQRNLHGPALLLCGGEDTTVPCSSIENAFNAISNQPVMLAEYLTADHANWVTFRGTDISPMETAVTAWMRVQLMGDTSLRSWFYGASCGLCTDSAWQVSQSMMDE